MNIKSFIQFLSEGKKTYKTYPLGTVLHWVDFQNHILDLPLKDSFGRMAIEDKKHMSAASEEWVLKCIDPKSLKEIDDKNCDLSMPIIISYGDVLDGRRRLQTARNNDDKSISAWVGIEE